MFSFVVDKDDWRVHEVSLRIMPPIGPSFPSTNPQNGGGAVSAIVNYFNMASM